MRKTAIITGAAKGIGRATALAFHNNDYNIVVHYNNSKIKAEELVNFINNNNGAAISAGGDLNDYSAAQMVYDAAIKRFGRVDTLINNCGKSLYKMYIDSSPDEIMDIINTNLISSMYMSRIVLPDMVKRNNGVIINVSSMWGLSGASMEAIYSAAKAGLIGFTKALAKEYSYMGIRVNAVCPGVTDTDMFSCFNETDKKEIIESIPLQRVAQPDEIADAIYFAATNDFMTGSVINITGGSII